MRSIQFYNSDVTSVTQISIINMYISIKIRHDILIQCHVNYMEMNKFNYVLEIDILRNSLQKN